MAQCYSLSEVGTRETLQEEKGFIFWLGHLWWLSGKASTCNTGSTGSIPGLGQSSGGGHGNPLQYSCLENPMDRGAWWATIHGVTKSQTRLKQLGTRHTTANTRQDSWENSLFLFIFTMAQSENNAHFAFHLKHFAVLYRGIYISLYHFQLIYLKYWCKECYQYFHFASHSVNRERENWKFLNPLFQICPLCVLVIVISRRKLLIPLPNYGP